MFWIRLIACLLRFHLARIRKEFIKPNKKLMMLIYMEEYSKLNLSS